MDYHKSYNFPLAHIYSSHRPTSFSVEWEDRGGWTMSATWHLISRDSLSPLLPLFAINIHFYLFPLPLDLRGAEEGRSEFKLNFPEKWNIFLSNDPGIGSVKYHTTIIYSRVLIRWNLYWIYHSSLLSIKISVSGVIKTLTWYTTFTVFITLVVFCTNYTRKSLLSPLLSRSIE